MTTYEQLYNFIDRLDDDDIIDLIRDIAIPIRNGHGSILGNK